MEYILEASTDGKRWVHKGTHIKGEMSRFGLPFDEEVIIKEAKSFRDFWQKDGWKYVRIIIEI